MCSRCMEVCQANEIGRTRISNIIFRHVIFAETQIKNSSREYVERKNLFDIIMHFNSLYAAYYHHNINFTLIKEERLLY